MEDKTKTAKLSAPSPELKNNFQSADVTKFEERELNMKVNKVKDLFEKQIIGKAVIYMAMKNTNSFLILTTTRGLILIE